MATQKQAEANRQGAQQSAKQPTAAEAERARQRRRQRREWYEATRSIVSIRAPKTTPDLVYPEERVLEAGFPPANDPDFVAALEKLREAHPLNAEHAQRVALWLALTGWQLRRIEQARDALHQRMDAARAGVSVEERKAIRAGCRRELIAWNECELRVKKEHVQAVNDWQVLTGAKRRARRTPTPEDRIAHLLPYTPAYPPTRNLRDAWRESFLREALLLHFRTGVERLAAHGIRVPRFN